MKEDAIIHILGEYRVFKEMATPSVGNFRRKDIVLLSESVFHII
jgi:hypothetical protein